MTIFLLANKSVIGVFELIIEIRKKLLQSGAINKNG